MYILKGFVDGLEISFDYYPPNTFKANIPKKIEGIYIVELKCYDEAGNEAFWSDQLVQIDFKSMKMTQLQFSYKYSIGKCEYEDKQISNKYGYKEIQNKYIVKEVQQWQ